jgi:hypothetical protein
MVDHIWVILIAFLASLGAFTAVALVGSDPISTQTLRDILFALAGGLTGVAVGAGLQGKRSSDDDAPSSS